MKRFGIILFCLITIKGISQNQGNIWYFGDGAGIDFSSGAPQVLTDGQTSFVGCPGCHAEGTAVISDNIGNLLFYTDGNKIWNRIHQTMPNGDSLISNISATQGSLILPKPGSNQYYYVFNVDDFNFNNLQGGLTYSKVDICLDNGLGDVQQDFKNIPLETNMTEKLTAVQHQNGIDFWIISHKFQSNTFCAFRLTSSGISDTIYSNVGSTHTGNVGASIGQLKGSPNGQKIAIVNGQATTNIAEYLDFDATTGAISNPVSLQTNPNWGYYGVSFSPDNTKLYLACSLNGNGIYQFDLNAGGGNPASVLGSMTQIADTYNYLGLQLANNGKIYTARSPFGFNDYIGVINEPNFSGISCNYIDSAVYLNGRSASYGFPNFLDSYDYTNSSADCPIVSIDENYPNTTQPVLLKIVDLLGRETAPKPNQMLLYLYSDGTIEKMIWLE